MHSESTMLNLHMKKNLMSNRHVENIALLDFKPIAFSFLNLPERFNYYTVRDTRTTEHPISDHVVQLSRTVSLKLNRFHESFDPLFSEKKKRGTILQRTSRCQMGGYPTKLETTQKKSTSRE